MRPTKLTHAETILYEIDMLRYAARNLETGEKWARWTFLECFLLHFRNLIEFFGKNPERDNLSIQRPKKFWPRGFQPPTQDLALLSRPDLWEKYEGQGKPDKVSRYLQHCTEQRVENKSWDVKMMGSDIFPVLKAFEKILPVKERSWDVSSHEILALPSASLSTATTPKRVVMVSSNRFRE